MPRPQVTCARCGKIVLGYKPASTRPPQKYCSPTCYYEARSKPLHEKFWSRVQKTNSCWLWEGRLTKAGYGQISHRGTPIYTHRLSWEIHKGSIPKKMEVCHHCDNPACVNPDHLFIGSHRDNMHDMLSKNRGSTAGLADQRGEKHPGAKITEDIVRAIRQRLRSKESHSSIAKDLGISRPTVTAINCGRLWGWLPN